MKIAIIGRSEVLYDTVRLLQSHGHEIVLIWTAKEAPEYTRTSEDFRLLARDWQIPFCSGSTSNEIFALVDQVKADIAVSVNFPRIVPQSFIELFPLGILNAHGGDLPRYRGNACQAWAILNGEERIGLCVHKMVGGQLDNGDIISRDFYPICLETKITEVHTWIGERVPQLMLDAVEALDQDPMFILERQSKAPEDSLRCYPRRPEDGRINWHVKAVDVLRLINASNKPYSGAFCEFEGENIVIWDAELVEDGEVFLAVPGQIAKINDSSVEVACGEGKIRLKNIEVPGSAKSLKDLAQSTRSRFT